MKSDKPAINLLVLNCGSSSLKYRIISMPDEVDIVQGEAERVGIKTRDMSEITHTVWGKTRVVKVHLASHEAALTKALELIGEDARTDSRVTFSALVHRYVHPGTRFSKPTKVNKTVIHALRDTLCLAAIHNPITFHLIEYCARDYAAVPQYVVFDTAFHRTIPPAYATYALPAAITRKYGLRKIGFHGISHRYVMEEACAFLKRSPRQCRIISCHLGTGGSSVCAINQGKSINSSMGFTPLEGLAMNTRCGDIDPGLIFYIMSKENMTPLEAEQLLNKQSGILGMYNVSSDLREVIAHIDTDPRAAMAFNMYVNRVRAYIGFYALILKKADILILTDSLGVGLPILRQSICRDMKFLGIEMDDACNQAYRGGIGHLSSAASETTILVVPTNEEVMMAREAYKEFL